MALPRLRKWAGKIYPALYRWCRNSRLFIYYTADNYSTTGCYNLSCGAFVQVNNSWYFGGGFSNYSTYGGAQYDFSAEYYLYNGNWWLALGAERGELATIPARSIAAARYRATRS